MEKDPNLVKEEVEDVEEEGALGRYNRHHEFPTSLSSSIVIHVLLLLILGLILHMALRKEQTPPEVDVAFIGMDSLSDSGGGDESEWNLLEESTDSASADPNTSETS